jgi:spermidine synthase
MILLESIESDFGDIEILKTRQNSSYIYKQGGCCQSEADADGVSLSSYVHAMYGLLAQAVPRDVLMIGCGGGTLGTMLARIGVEVTIVDVNPQSFNIARQYFNLSPEIVCHVGDGRDFLLSNSHQYGAIILDAYVGSVTPAHLLSRSFFRLARARLDVNSGCLLANVHVLHDLDDMPDGVAEQMADAWQDVGLLDMRGVTNRNAIVIAGKVRDLQRPGLLVEPLAGVEEILYDLDQWAFRPWYRSRRRP